MPVVLIVDDSEVDRRLVGGLLPKELDWLVEFADNKVSEGKGLRIDVQLKHKVGGSYVDEGAEVYFYTNAADKKCVGACSTTVVTSDVAPSDGTITLRSRYGSWFRPEGALLGAVSVMAGTPAKANFMALPCHWSVRAWYYPKTGDTTPRMLPAQYWPGEFQVNELGASNPYFTSFAVQQGY